MVFCACMCAGATLGLRSSHAARCPTVKLMALEVMVNPPIMVDTTDIMVGGGITGNIAKAGPMGSLLLDFIFSTFQNRLDNPW